MEQNIDFSIILPTRDRPKLLVNLFKSLEDTTKNLDKIEVILYLDPEDKESFKVSSTKFKIKKIVGQNDTMGNITRRCFEETCGKYIVLLNDDIIIRTLDWDMAVLDAFSKFPDEIAMVYPNDLYYRKRMCCFPILTRKVAILLDNIVPKEYGRHSIDSHIFDIFYKLTKKGFKRAIYLKRVVFEHMNLSVISGLNNQSVDSKKTLDDQRRYNDFSQYREKIADELMASIVSLKKRETHSLIQLTRDKLSLIFVLKEWALLSTHKNLDLIANNADLLNSVDSVVMLGRLALLKYLKIPKKLKRVTERIPILTTEMTMQHIFQFAKSNNTSKWLAFIDGTSEISEGWPLSSILYATQNKDVGIIVPRWLNPRSGNIEQAGIAIFKSGRGIEVSELYHGCNEMEVYRGEPREVQLAGLSGMITLRDEYVNIGGIKLITQSALDLAGFCVDIKKLGKKIIYDPKSTLFYATENVIPRESLLKWEKEFKYDLEETLKKDGYLLHRTETNYYLFPSDDLINEFKRNGNMIGLKRLLDKTLEIAKMFKASIEDIEFLESELLTLKEEGMYPQVYQQDGDLNLNVDGSI